MNVKITQTAWSIMATNDEMSQEFAEGVAVYMIAHNVEKYTPDLNIKVWMLGQNGIAKLKLSLQ